MQVSNIAIYTSSRCSSRCPVLRAEEGRIMPSEAQGGFHRSQKALKRHFWFPVLGLPGLRTPPGHKRSQALVIFGEGRRRHTFQLHPLRHSTAEHLHGVALSACDIPCSLTPSVWDPVEWLTWMLDDPWHHTMEA